MQICEYFIVYISCTSNNKISGKILIEIGNLINLERLDTWKNKFSGNIPFEIGKLQKLQILALNTKIYMETFHPLLEI